MRIAYADPPYPGHGHRYPEKKEVNHRLLITHLQEFDGWALSTLHWALKDLLPYCPDNVRIAAWVKPFASFRPGVTPSFAWEPVLFRPARLRRFRYVADWFSESATLGQRWHGVLGAKPTGFCMWIFNLLLAEPNDEFVDLFPGSGAVSRAWEAWRRQTRLFDWEENLP